MLELSNAGRSWKPDYIGQNLLANNFGTYCTLLDVGIVALQYLALILACGIRVDWQDSRLKTAESQHSKTILKYYFLVRHWWWWWMCLESEKTRLLWLHFLWHTLSMTWHLSLTSPRFNFLTCQQGIMIQPWMGYCK